MDQRYPNATSMPFRAAPYPTDPQHGQQRFQTPDGTMGTMDARNANVWADRQQLHAQGYGNGETSYQTQQASYPTVEENGQRLQTTAGGGPESVSALKAEIQRLHSDADAVERTLQDAAAKLFDAEDQLAETRNKLAAKEAECAWLHRQVRVQGGGSPGMATTQQTYYGNMTPHSGMSSPDAGLQQKIAELTASVSAKEDAVRVVEAKMQEERTAWGQTESELQKQVQFFKINSERVGRQSRELKAENNKLGDELAAAQRELGGRGANALGTRL